MRRTIAQQVADALWLFFMATLYALAPLIAIALGFFAATVFMR